MLKLACTIQQSHQILFTFTNVIGVVVPSISSKSAEVFVGIATVAIFQESAAGWLATGCAAG